MESLKTPKYQAKLRKAQENKEIRRKDKKNKERPKTTKKKP